MNQNLVGLNSDLCGLLIIKDICVLQETTLNPDQISYNDVNIEIPDGYQIASIMPYSTHVYVQIALSLIDSKWKITLRNISLSTTRASIYVKVIMMHK